MAQDAAGAFYATNFESNVESRILTLDLETGTGTQVAPMDRVVRVLAARLPEPTPRPFEASITSRIVGDSPGDIAPADLDGDGGIDLAVLEDYQGVAVLFNQGNGVLASPVSHAIGPPLQSLEAGDIDGDRDLDLVTADYGLNQVVVLTNDGTGGLGVSRYPVSDFLQRVRLADLDADGVADVIAIHALPVLDVFLSGPGGLSGSVEHSVGSNLSHAVAADLDDDGDIDIAVSDYVDATGTKGAVFLLVNDGAGSFGAGGSQEFPGRQLGLIGSGDLDGDGDSDLVVTTRTIGGLQISYYDTVGLFNLGGGVFAPEVSLVPYWQTTTPPLIRNLNGGCGVDIALGVADFVCCSGRLQFFAGSGGGAFDCETSDECAAFTLPEPFVTGLAAADLDADGDADLAASSADFGNPVDGHVTVLFNTTPR
jgi:hypothetical protein